MESRINYIYGADGQAEYVVVPIQTWKDMQTQIQAASQAIAVFDPMQYWGCLSMSELDIEQELSLMRKEWNRDF